MSVVFNLPRSIGWLGQQSEPGVQARTLVDERFDAIAALVEEAKTSFDDSIAAMHNTLSPIIVNDIAVNEIGAIPDLGSDIPSFNEVFTKTFTETLEDFSVAYTEPEGKPGPFTETWEDPNIELEASLVSKLAYWLTSGETAIPAAILDQIYDGAIVAVDENRVNAIAVAESRAAAQNYDIPPGALENKIIQIEREYAKASTELIGNLASKNMELTQANFHKVVDVANAYITAAKEYIVNKNLAKVQWYSASVEVWIKQVDAEIKSIQAQAEIFAKKVDAFIAKAEVFKTEAEVYESTVRAYVANVEALKAKYSVMIENIRLKVQVFQVETTAAIEEEKLRVEAQIANQNLAEKMAESEAGLRAQMVSSGLSGMHVQASISSSHGTGQQVGYSYSYGEQLSEQHSESQSTSINAEV